MMRTKLIASIFGITLMMGVPAPVAHAQSNNDPLGPVTVTPAINDPTAPVTVTPQVNPNSVAPAGNSTPINLNGNPISQSSDMLDYLMGKLMSLFAFLLGVAAITLDNAMYYTVVHMGSYITSLSAVGVAWSILRDVGNIVLIFGFIALGVCVILDVDWYGGGTKFLPALLIAAVLLNFSLFIAEAVIDTGNLFATEFYTQINGGSAAAPQDYNLSDIHNEGISTAVMNKLGLQTIYSGAYSGAVGGNQSNSAILQSGHPFILGFMSILLFMVAAFVFFSLAFILIARFVFLIFLIIIAPVGIAGLAVPKLEKSAALWLSKLLQQTMTAPVMLLMLYVALRVITDANFLTGFAQQSASGGAAVQTAWTTWLTSNTGTDLGGLASAMLSFIVAMGLLLMVTVLSTRLGAAGAGWINKTTQGLLTYPGRVGAKWIVGSTGVGLEKFRKTRVGRVAVGATRVATLGLVGDYELKQYAGQMKKATFGTMGSVGDRLDFAKQNKLELDSATRKREAKGAIDTAIKKGGPDMDHNISTVLKTLSDKEVFELDGIKDGVQELVRNLSPQQFKSYMDNKEVSEGAKAKAAKARFADVRTKVAKAEVTGATAADIDAAQKAVASINTKEMPYIGDDFLTKDFVAANFTNDQADYLGKEGVLSPSQRSVFDSKRKDRFDPAKTPPATIAAAIKSTKWNRDQINKIPGATVSDSNVLDALGLDALNLIDVVRRGTLSPTDRKKLGTYFEDVATSPTDPRQADFAAYLAADPRVQRDLLIP